jgi:extracellular nuclease
VENGEYTKISDLLSADTTSYDIENIKTNTDFSFVVTSVCKMDGKEKESAWSNIAEVTTAKRDYKVNYSVDNKNAADIKVRHLGNVEIKSGDEISESEIIKVKVTPKSGQYELVSLTLDNGGESMIFTPEADGTIECAFTLNGEANMRVSTKRAINSAQITFTDTYTADGTVIGTVSVAVGDVPLNAPGGTVTDNVTFTAVPGKGYGLKSWKITDASGTTETIDAAGSNSYTLGLASEKYTVEAEFVSLSEIGRLVKVNLPAEGGTVEITDANGDSVTLNENNSVYVPVNSKLTFTVMTDAGCKFRAWTDDAEGQSGESFTMTITKDTEIGAEFDVPVRLKLTYSAASGEQTGAVVTKQGYQSGTGVIVGTKIVLTAQAAENYRVQKLVITRDDKVDTVTTDDKLYSQYDYEIVMDTKTDIQVYFTEIEQYTVTVDSIENADMTVKNGNEDFVSGNTVRYADEITVTVKPNENYRLADAASWIDNGDGSYTYKTGAIKADTNILVKIEEIPEYTVTFPTTIDGCILSVKNDKEKISSGDKLREGTRLTATVTLDPTFILKGWYIGGELLSETNKNEITFTVDSDILLTVIVTDVKGDTGDQGDQGDKGDTGATGVGVKSVTIDEDGNLIITLTDDTVHNAGKVTGDKGEQGNQGDKGDKGDKGDTGIGVKSVAIDDDGNLIITLTDDTVHNAGKVNASNGENGRNGADGVGIENAVVDENGNLIITLSDGTVHNLGKVTGEKGDAGKDGQDGSNGNGIQSAEIDADGNLIITFTDGVVTNLGKIVGTDGKNGTDGKDGKDGADGKDGIGIKGCRIDDDGNLILTLTDNTTLDAGNISAISDSVNVSKPLATAAVSVAGTSLLWNVVSVAISIIRKKKLV